MTNKSSLYLYAIVPASVNFFDLRGIDDAVISTVVVGNVAALVSIVASKKIRPQRKNLSSHHQVLKSLMLATTPLPMKFGMVAANENEVKDSLKRHQVSFLDQLAYVENTVEMGLRLNWSVPNIFEYLVDSRPELKLIREQALKNSAIKVSRDDMIEVGYRFSQVLESERQRHAKTVQTALTGCCLDTRVNSLQKENEVMNLACLISKDKMALFEKTVYDVANLFNDDFALDYNGPWAPHNFVDIHIENLDSGV